jgi:hypothetical protein
MQKLKARDTMYRAKSNGDENVFKCGKIEGEKTPLGYKVTEVFFVDNSGCGTRGEMALVASDFLSKVKIGRYYAITGIGQFQVYVTEYKKIAGSRKALYKELGILKSKLVKNNTRLTEYVDGRRTLRLHATDILTWKPDGVIVLNSGGYRTHTTKERLNAFLPLGIRVYQKNYSWYVRQDGKKDIDFVDGMEL